MGLFVKQHETIHTEVTDLEEKLSHVQDQNEFLLITIRALFYFIKEFSLDLTEIGSEKFKQGIDSISKRFIIEEKTKKLWNYFEDSKNIILSYINKEKDYFNQREEEYKNIIELLSISIHKISEDNDEFTVTMYQSSSQIEKITYLDDIRKMKEELRREVSQIKQSIKEKQQRDARRLEALSREVEGLKVDFERARSASLTDGLTGVYNRYAFDTRLTQLVDRNMISPMPFSLLLLDIDNFKRINDTYGHPVGDRVILAVAQQCQELIRKDDFMARYGGEEFAIILAATSLRHSVKKARAICKAIAASRYALDMQQSRTTVTFSVSIGVSAFRPGDTADSLIGRADKALYEAKRLGKNRAASEKHVVAVADGSSGP